MPGLDLFADFNLPLSVIPHWNNTDGGDEVDTSRCFIGIERFNQWCDLLPPGHTTVGLDEHTGIIIDFACWEMYRQRGEFGDTAAGVQSENFPGRERSSRSPNWVSSAGRRIPKPGFPPEPGKWLIVLNRLRCPEETPAEVVHLADERQQARLRQDWANADILRQQMASLGWLVQDTPDGQKIVKQPEIRYNTQH